MYDLKRVDSGIDQMDIDATGGRWCGSHSEMWMHPSMEGSENIPEPRADLEARVTNNHIEYTGPREVRAQIGCAIPLDSLAGSKQKKKPAPRDKIRLYVLLGNSIS